jgi:predicted nucleic acid-binding protein
VTHRIYVETTIPSFYFELREAPARRWWAAAIEGESLVTSVPVLDELAQGEFSSRTECLDLLDGLPLLAVDQAVIEVVDTYIRHQVMPRDPAGDALHLALASVHGCHFLATWNCRHLANPNKFDHIRRVNAMIGIQVPALVTPYELLGGADG